ncbi:MAG TPA: AgmX/PglI C-terminal domain-containing protein, partial [Polyangia bacterium]
GLSAVNTPTPTVNRTTDNQLTNAVSVRSVRIQARRRWYRNPWVMFGACASIGIIAGGVFGNLSRDIPAKDAGPLPTAAVPRVLPMTAPPPAAIPEPAPATSPPPESPAPAAVAAAKPRSPRPTANKPRPASVGILDRATLDSVIKGGRQRFAGCFRTHAAQLPSESGQVRIEIAVQGNGRVTATKVSALPENAVGLIGCLEQSAQQLRFPRHTDQEVRFAFPLLYRRGE